MKVRCEYKVNINSPGDSHLKNCSVEDDFLVFYK